MQIDLNGMYYIVNLTVGGRGKGLTAEIVDEAFCGPVRRAPATCLGDMVRLIRQHTGLKPDADTLQDLSEHLEAHLDRAMADAGKQVVLAEAG
ncbi:MAG: hypothetical protein AAGJ28_01350 [Pseudomonadota bacterium]